MPLNPTLDQPWFTPLRTAIPLAGRGAPPPADPPRPDYIAFGADADWDWQSGLPSCPSSWAETEADALLRTSVDVGLPKTRRRWTKPVKLVSVTMPIKRVLTPKFWAMYDITLQNGLLSFLYMNPLTKEWHVYKFASPPELSSGDGIVVQISMSWEQIK